MTGARLPYAASGPGYESDTTLVGETNKPFVSFNPPDVPLAFPNADSCLAHLQLLSVFHALKEDVGCTDGLFNLWDIRCENAENVEETLARMREKRWALYVARAVERFEDWWLQVLVSGEPSKRLEAKEMISTNLEFRQWTRKGRVRQWTRAMLPPIDVLMVWHSFMLNPRNYLEDCIRFGLKDLWTTGMPWKAVNACIDSRFNYEAPLEAQTDFVNKTGHNWDNALDSFVKKLSCPRCSQQLEIPWSTCCASENTSGKELADMSGIGYGDHELSHICSRCGVQVNHDLLRVGKFKRDTENLSMRDWPLGGTILSGTTGFPKAPTEKEWKTHFETFPNRLIGVQLRSSILELVNTSNPSMNSVKELIEKAINKKSTVRKANSAITLESGSLRQEERISIRRMMSRYWDNTSIFALELGGAVIRQSVFVNKMHRIDWLHSPAARYAMNRLLIKYTRFIEIIATFPLESAVPTLDVDLGWHTHQLSPKSYFDFTLSKCRKLIGHDDKMDEDDLSKGFEWTCKTYETLYQEVYSECTCWYCEAIRAKTISSSTKIFGTSKHEKALKNFYSSGRAKRCPPDNSAHISSHASVKALEAEARRSVVDALHKKYQTELENAYEKACKYARSNGRPVPDKDDYYKHLSHGPHKTSGMTDGVYYAGDPCVMPVGTGIAGACVAGTCRGGIAAGGCRGPGCGNGGGCAAGPSGCGGTGGGCGGVGGGGCRSTGKW